MKKNKLLIILSAVSIVAIAAYFLLFNDNSVEVSTMNSYKANIIKTIEVQSLLRFLAIFLNDKEFLREFSISILSSKVKCL